jgi:hypothetical protein
MVLGSDDPVCSRAAGEATEGVRRVATSQATALR